MSDERKIIKKIEKVMNIIRFKEINSIEATQEYEELLELYLSLPKEDCKTQVMFIAKDPKSLKDNYHFLRELFIKNPKSTSSIFVDFTLHVAEICTKNREQSEDLNIIPELKDYMTGKNPLFLTMGEWNHIERIKYFNQVLFFSDTLFTYVFQALETTNEWILSHIGEYFFCLISMIEIYQKE